MPSVLFAIAAEASFSFITVALAATVAAVAITLRQTMGSFWER